MRECESAAVRALAVLLSLHRFLRGADANQQQRAHLLRTDSGRCSVTKIDLWGVRQQGKHLFTLDFGLPLEWKRRKFRCPTIKNSAVDCTGPPYGGFEPD